MGKKKNDKIRISFVGTNATEVTGSMTLIEYPTSDGGTKKILLEIGLNQTNNIKNDYEVNSRKFKFKPRELDFVIINHLHGDHSLLSGRLFKEGCSCPVIMPKGSFGFMTHMIMDSCFIMARDAEALTRIRKKETYPIYTEEDAKTMLSNIVEYDTHQVIQLDDYVSMEFIPSGHIEFACQLTLWIKKPN
jgi:metallo-beta-lactamase family protein